jgi:hypothetical protein
MGEKRNAYLKHGKPRVSDGEFADFPAFTNGEDHSVSPPIEANYGLVCAHERKVSSLRRANYTDSAPSESDSHYGNSTSQNSFFAAAENSRSQARVRKPPVRVGALKTRTPKERKQ